MPRKSRETWRFSVRMEAGKVFRTAKMGASFSGSAAAAPARTGAGSSPSARTSTVEKRIACKEEIRISVFYPSWAGAWVRTQATVHGKCHFVRKQQDL